MKNIFGISALILSTAAFAAVGEHPGTTSTDSSNPSPSDAQIAAIVNAANNEEIDTAKIVKSKTQNPQIKAFAETMIQDHTRANKDLHQVMRKLVLHKSETDTTKGMKQEAKENMDKLKGLKGDELDRTYAQEEVKDHESVLSNLDNNLIPNAKTDEMKQYLKDTRAVIARHLERAQNLNQALWPKAKQ